VSSLKLLIIYKGKRYVMKINTNIKAGAGADGDPKNHNEKMASDNKGKRFTVKTGIKAGFNFTKIEYNHNEKLQSDINSVEQKKRIGKKLRLSKETIRILKDSDLKQIAGGAGVKSTNDPTAC
jgi:hypothetical protein